MLLTRFVDTAGKARFVENEFETWSTNEYDAQTTAMATNRLIDVLAGRRKHSSLAVDTHRLHLEVGESVLVDASQVWEDAEAAAGRDSTRLWRMKSCAEWTQQSTSSMARFFSGKFSKSQLGCCESTAHPISFAVLALVANLHVGDLLMFRKSRVPT